MKVAARYLFAIAVSAASALLMLTLTMPLYLIAATGSLGGIALLIGPLLTPIIILIGATAALPAAMIAGGAMLFWQRQRGRAFGPIAWMIAGATAGLLAASFASISNPWQAQMASTVWIVCSATLGSWVFGRTTGLCAIGSDR